ncbi:MAG: tetratricopeptide repeat protein, partial [Cyanobacteria bacterium J06631_6]
AWYYQGCCYQALQNRNWAIICLEKAIDIYPTKYLNLAVNDPAWSEYRLQPGFKLLIINKSHRYQIEIPS